jgi:hypothetical protein
MKKKTIILIAVIVAVVIGVLVYMHYTPVWVSISNVIFGAVGIVVGWIAHVLYNKYIKE